MSQKSTNQFITIIAAIRKNYIIRRGTLSLHCSLRKLNALLVGSKGRTYMVSNWVGVLLGKTCWSKVNFDSWLLFGDTQHIKRYKMPSYSDDPLATSLSGCHDKLKKNFGLCKSAMRRVVSLDPFIKTFFLNFEKCWAVLCYILINKQMLEKVFCSNIAPSLSSGNHLFYKAEYMGQNCLCQVWAITLDWSALATWNKHFWTVFW